MDDRELFEVLMSDHEQSFEKSDFDRAYHLLASAMHFAEASQNASWLVSIATRSAWAQKEIDVRAPEYQHSSQSAARRRTKGIFLTLASTARTASSIQAHKKYRDQM